MAISKQELLNWVSSIPDENAIAIDDGGLALIAVGNEDIYLEVGGTAESAA